MVDNTEETLVNGISEDKIRSVLNAAKGNKKASKGIKVSWKKVAIGGTSGLILGSSSVYAIDKIADGYGVDGLKVATKVDDDQSFKEAFDTAHEEVGSGGLFEWHGNIYSTYSDKEWDALPSEERDAFNEKIAAQEQDIDDAIDAAHEMPNADNDVVAHVDAQDDGDDIRIIGSDDSVEIAQNDDVYVVDVDDAQNTEDAIGELASNITDALSEGLSDVLPDNMEDNYLADNADSSSSSDEVFMA